MSTSNTSSHEKIQKKKKKSQSASLTRWYPSSPRAGAFLLFGVWLQTFLPASSKSNNKPSVPWERRGGRARWERGIRHTADTRPAGGGEKCTEEWQRKRTKSRHLKGVFSSEPWSLALWERWRVKQKSKMQRGKKKTAMSFIRFGGWGNSLKALGLLPKNPFPTISKGHNQLRGSGRSFSMIHFWGCTQASQYKVLFLFPSTGKLIGTQK